MYTIHATKKLLERVKQPVEAPVAKPSTLLGSWYATVLFWKPQVALLVNERTLVPVLLPLGPAGRIANGSRTRWAGCWRGWGCRSSSCFRRWRR